MRTAGYAQLRPYAAPPRRLSDLVGPVLGIIELPLTIDWGPPRIYDMAADTDRRVVFERVLREAGTTSEICRYVNGKALVEAWPKLWLPPRVRSMWERRFPVLCQAA